MLLHKKSLGNLIVIFKIILLTFHIILIVHIHLNYLSSKQIVYNYTREILLITNTKYDDTIETCRTVCKNIPSIPKHKIDELKQIGVLPLDTKLLDNMSVINDAFLPHHIGGSWMFKEETNNSKVNCNHATESGVAIIFVCRDRWKQLNTTLSTLIPLLQKQRLCYRIFVIEQEGDAYLNKAMLMNIGFIEAKKHFLFNCIIFHDADLVPMNDRIPYGCDEQTKQAVIHLSVSVSSWNYILPYKTLIGGVLKISNEHFINVNGYSNSYWGWGAEDDDFEKRLNALNIKYIHINSTIGRYYALPHKKQIRSKLELRYSLLNKAVQRMNQDGLNSLQYNLTIISEKQYYTYFLVSIK
ncbi:unnamed protein product [Heterobilharzia americana]|nr:unnamed protein product [Heterobilharzia americana]CAH8588222.1 unnamed protein product [Heterobilharzia americana]